MRKCIYLCTGFAGMHGRRINKGLGIFRGQKKPAQGRALFKRAGLASVHAPPEDVTEDADLLFLDLLEAVVLIRVFIAVEAAQADPCR